MMRTPSETPTGKVLEHRPGGLVPVGVQPQQRDRVRRLPGNGLLDGALHEVHSFHRVPRGLGSCGRPRGTRTPNPARCRGPGSPSARPRPRRWMSVSSSVGSDMPSNVSNRYRSRLVSSRSIKVRAMAIMLPPGPDATLHHRARGWRTGLCPAASHDAEIRSGEVIVYGATASIVARVCGSRSAISDLFGSYPALLRTRFGRFCASTRAHDAMPGRPEGRRSETSTARRVGTGRPVSVWPCLCCPPWFG